MLAKTRANISHAYCSTAMDIWKLLQLIFLFIFYFFAQCFIQLSINNHTSTGLFSLLSVWLGVQFEDKLGKFEQADHYLNTKKTSVQTLQPRARGKLWEWLVSFCDLCWCAVTCAVVLQYKHIFPPSSNNVSISTYCGPVWLNTIKWPSAQRRNRIRDAWRMDSNT